MNETKKSVFSEDYDSVIHPKTAIYQVKDKRLAACLLAVGIRLRKDPPYLQVKTPDGVIHTTFNFLPSCDEGLLKTGDLIKAWSRDLDYISENPMHPFTFAMCAIRNYQDILEHLKNDVPYVAFSATADGKKATLLVKEGSRKHKAAEDRGMKRI